MSREYGFVCSGGAALWCRQGEVSINSLGEMASTSKDATSPAKKKKGVLPGFSITNSHVVAREGK